MARLRAAARLVPVVLKGTIRRFLDARGFDLASSLAYAALLTIVPLMASVTVLTSTLFGMTGEGLYRVLRWVVPGARRDVLMILRTWSLQAATLTGTVTIFFLLASLRTFFQVEGAAQTLWGTTVHPRPVLQRLALAFSVTVLGPVAVGVFTSFLLETGASFTEFRFLGFLSTLAVLAVLYRFLPGAYVRWGPAAIGAAAAALGLTILRIVFAKGARMLTTFDTMLSHIYGSISAVVVFILAVGFAFALLLLGVSLAHAVQYREELLWHDAPPRTARGGPLYEAVRLLLPLAEAWLNDRAARTLVSIADEVKRPQESVKAVLARLAQNGLVADDGERGWVLRRSPDEISLYAVARALGESELRAVPEGDDRVAQTLREVFLRANRVERGVLQGTSLRDLLGRPAGSDVVPVRLPSV
jgi:YihY family inner membrane protein